MRVAAFMDQPCINVVSSGLEPYGADMQVWTPALMSCPISRNTSRQCFRYNGWISTLLDAWDSHTWASEPFKELVSSHCSSAVAPSNECQWHGLCLLWQLTLKYLLPPERLQACTRRCQMQAHDPVSTDGPVGPCTPVRLVQVELSKGDARSPESSESPPFQCNAREPFRKREPPKLSWPRLTVDDVLLIQCWGGAFSQCFKF